MEMRTHDQIAKAIADLYTADDKNPTPALYLIAEILNDTATIQANQMDQLMTEIRGLTPPTDRNGFR